ncbi:hypothetical protein Desde_3543 [Desulfitobacterium dehalogenans ATCC 51507]|uniref:Uncharacterized protein n=1 Tax=Desulfitobacterium dehalogenans (strain ATCC 51507 / DSM 9161 / JW/IU-DC1) TaxID=756499 RepID=I4ACY9_DESDJ|nr:hypothetical protein [Desulfitobacterium dehalogenans]AFM01824.1 hypothetical protein Desde_3543 [Desulfitobacterium dehalogenans ATCC 51507]
MLAAWRKYLISMNRETNHIAIWGTGAKGVTFANMLIMSEG